MTENTVCTAFSNVRITKRNQAVAFILRATAWFLFFSDLQPGQRIVNAHLHKFIAGTARLGRYILRLRQHGVGQLHRYHRGRSYRGFALRHNKFILLRLQYSQIRGILVLPFRGYQSCWTAAQQARAARIESMVDKVVYCCDAPSREAFLARDRHLVEGSAYCIGYCTRTTVGTAYTLRYAEKQGVQIWNVINR